MHWRHTGTRQGHRYGTHKGHRYGGRRGGGKVIETRSPDSLSGSHTRTILTCGVVWTALSFGLLLAWLVIRPGNSSFFQTGELILRVAGPLGVLPLCVIGLGAMRNWKILLAVDARTVTRWFPVVLGLAVLGFVLGRLIATLAVVTHGANGGSLSVPSAADVGSLSSYVFLLAAILLLPGSQLSLASRMRMFLDIMLIMSGIAAFAWYFILGPVVLKEHDALMVKLVNSAYPLGDLFVVSCLLFALALMRERSHRWIVLFSLSLVILTGADSIHEYQVLHGLAPLTRATSGTILDAARSLAFMLMCLVAGMAPLPVGIEKSSWRERSTIGPISMIQGSSRRTPTAWRFLLPYCSVPAVVALMIYAARSAGDPHLAYGVYIAGAVLIELVLLHQFLDYRELISLASRSARLENLAAADPVTGLPNHRTVVSALDLEISRSRRYRHSCAVLFMDLDHFKALNDSCGHSAGDAALREFAAVVRSALRDQDVLGRWGGEEFVAVLPEIDRDGAVGVAERVRFAVAAHTFWAAGGAHLTCSIGAVSYPDDADSREVLVEKADEAMYSAKRLGRNQVRSAADSAQPTGLVAAR